MQANPEEFGFSLFGVVALPNPPARSEIPWTAALTLQYSAQNGPNPAPGNKSAVAKQQD
jgi:hypothetical protein